MNFLSKHFSKKDGFAYTIYFLAISVFYYFYRIDPSYYQNEMANLWQDATEYFRIKNQIFQEFTLPRHNRPPLFPFVWGLSEVLGFSFHRFMLVFHAIVIFLFTLQIKSVFKTKQAHWLVLAFGLVIMLTRTNMGFFQTYLTESIMLAVTIATVSGLLFTFFQARTNWQLFFGVFLTSIISLQLKPYYLPFILVFGFIVFTTRLQLPIARWYARAAMAIAMLAVIFVSNRLINSNKFNFGVARKNTAHYYLILKFDEHYLPLVDKDTPELIVRNLNILKNYRGKDPAAVPAGQAVADIFIDVPEMTKYFLAKDPWFFIKQQLLNFYRALKHYSIKGEVGVYRVPSFSLPFFVERGIYVISFFGMILLSLLAYAQNKVFRATIFNTAELVFIFTLNLSFIALFLTPFIGNPFPGFDYRVTYPFVMSAYWFFLVLCFLYLAKGSKLKRALTKEG